MSAGILSVTVMMTKKMMTMITLMLMLQTNHHIKPIVKVTMMTDNNAYTQKTITIRFITIPIVTKIRNEIRPNILS